MSVEEQIADLAVAKLECAADAFVAEMIGRQPSKSGAMAAATEHEAAEVSGTRATCTWKVGVDYASYQNDGTGPIVPVSARVLHFEVGGEEVFAMRTSGVPASHYVEDTEANFPAHLAGCGG